MRTLGERFWSKVDRSEPDGCWNWTANRNNNGYGLFRPGGVAPKALAHRLSYEERHGPIPKGGLILHSCDNPSCVNPDHLRVGSHTDNALDREARGRRKSPDLAGEANPLSRLTDEQVISIRLDYVSGVPLDDICAKHDVPRISLSDYTSGTSWAHLLGVDGAPDLKALRAEAYRRRRNNARLTASDARSIRRRLAAGELGITLAAEYGVHKATISDIKCGKIWADA